MTVPSDLTRGNEAYADHLLGQVSNHPLLREVLHDDHLATRTVLRALGSGWTFDDLEALLDGSGSGSAEFVSAHWIVKELLPAYAHLAPALFQAWERVFPSMFAMAQQDAKDTVLIWEAAVPSGLGPACLAAGLTPVEAAALHEQGALTSAALSTVERLRVTG